jgi:hypothetical protein
MIRCQTSLVFLAVFLTLIAFNFTWENVKADNIPKYASFTKGICCDAALVEGNKEEDEGTYFNISYPCDNITAIFSLPNYTRNYILKGAVNEEGVLSLTLTPYNSKSILVITIKNSDKPFDNAPVSKERNLNYFLQDFYPTSISSPYFTQIDTCNGTTIEGKTEDPNRSVFGLTYHQDPLCNCSKTFRRVLMKTILNRRDFDKLIKTFKLQDEICD